VQKTCLNDAIEKRPKTQGCYINPDEGLIVGIDASRNRSGGAIAHLVGILSEGNPFAYNIREVHVWSYRALLGALPKKPWLFKHNPLDLERSLFWQVWWQATKLSSEAASVKCDMLFTTDASTFCRFRPMVVLSQDMLSYEPGVMKYFGYTRKYLRLLAIYLIQNRAFRFADGVIFLTKYAAKVIQQSCGPLPSVAYIPHGVGMDFKKVQKTKAWPEAGVDPIRCIYVSNTAMYKHQWLVVRAIDALRKLGHNITLKLVGGGTGKPQRLLKKQLAISDPHSVFIEQLGFVPQKELPGHLANADLFVFASSCENLPVTLLEAMAVGLPIACSNRGPMPEVLADGGVYFDPEDTDSISDAVEQIIKNRVLRERIAKRAKTISDQYSWSRCADETWTFIKETYKKKKADIRNKTIIDNDAIAWHNQIAFNWDTKYANRSGFKERHEVFSNLIRMYSKSENCVYDLGCGTGTFSFFALDLNSYIIGVDGSAEMIDICNKKKNTFDSFKRNNLKFIKCDISNIGFEIDRIADLVIASSVLEYMDDLEFVLSKVRTSLNKNGVIIFSLPNYPSFHRVFERLSFKIFGHPFYYKYVKQSIPLDRAIILTERCGYEILETKYFTKTPYLPRFLRDKYLYELFIIVARKK